MKLILYIALLWVVALLSCNRPTIEEPPTPNADSIRCVQAWQQFQIPKDTILQLRYQQPVTLINGTDTMAITVIQIDDMCSEESAKDTYGCEARIQLKMELNGSCAYQNKYSLTISRYGDGREGPNTITFKDFDCNVHYSSDPIINGSTGSVMAFYNISVLFRRLLPFAGTQAELIRFSTNKQQYTATVWLKKRCF